MLRRPGQLCLPLSPTCCTLVTQVIGRLFFLADRKFLPVSNLWGFCTSRRDHLGSTGTSCVVLYFSLCSPSLTQLNAFANDTTCLCALKFLSVISYQGINIYLSFCNTAVWKRYSSWRLCISCQTAAGWAVCNWGNHFLWAFSLDSV